MTQCFLVKFDLPEGAKPHNEPDIQSGLIEYIIQQRAQFLYGRGGAVVSTFPVACAFNQPGALCKHTVAELNAAAAAEAP
jgi:hypothetical protein